MILAKAPARPFAFPDRERAECFFINKSTSRHIASARCLGWNGILQNKIRRLPFYAFGIRPQKRFLCDFNRD